jgi:hypothetical protein
MTNRSVRVRRPEGHNELDRRGDVPLDLWRERRSRRARTLLWSLQPGSGTRSERSSGGAIW